MSEHPGDRIDLSQLSNGRISVGRRRGLPTPTFAGFVSSSPQSDGAGEDLAQRLAGFEAMPGGDRHAPRGDLLRAQLADRHVAERGDRLARQPWQLAQRRRLDVVLGEVLVDEFGERERA